MLNPPEEEYVPVPGNPNILMIGKKEKKEKKKIPTQKESPENIPIQKESSLPSLEETTILNFEKFIESPLRQAFLPFYKFVGFLEAESGKRIYYRYDTNLTEEDKKSPLVKGCKTVNEFKEKNSHLGQRILRILEPIAKVKVEKVGYNINELFQRYIDPNYVIQGNSYDNTLDFPYELWKILPLSSFQFILNIATYGAIQMAASELQKDLKLLIISDEVNYIFAEFVSKKFISPKQNAFISGGLNGQLQYRIASGFKTSVVANSKWFMACKIWFEEKVFEVMENNNEKAQAIYDRYRLIPPPVPLVVPLPTLFQDLRNSDLLDFELDQEDLFYEFDKFKKLGNRKVYKVFEESKIKKLKL